MQERILSAATVLFLEKGYDLVTLDEVVKIARVSKTSIYKAFGSKQALLLAVIEKCGCEIDGEPFDHPQNDDIATTLRAVGERYVRKILDHRSIAMMRLCLTLSVRFPEVGALFLVVGPKRSAELAAPVFRRWANAGLIETDEPEVTAAFFLNLLRGDHQVSLLCDPAYQVSNAEIEAHVKRAVELFLNGACSAAGRAI